MTFKIRYRYFKYETIFFGLINALPTIQGYINKILAEMLDVFIIVYPDNIFIYPKNK